MYALAMVQVDLKAIKLVMLLEVRGATDRGGTNSPSILVAYVGFGSLGQTKPVAA